MHDMKHIATIAAAMLLLTALRPEAAHAVEFVDLGLASGTLWANMNVGAQSPEDPGLFVAWGEKEAKTDYSWATYKWCDGTKSVMTKYVSNSEHGTVDGKYFLDAEDDAASDGTGAIGTPTVEELAELITDSTLTWTAETVNGRKCARVTGTNGNYIIIPAGGFKSGTRSLTNNAACCLWSNGLTTKSLTYYYSANVVRIGFQNNGVNLNSRDHNGAGFVPRNYGYNIRAVQRRTTAVTTVKADNAASPVVGIYNLQGMRQQSLMPGINIVRHADGTASKVLIP